MLISDTQSMMKDNIPSFFLIGFQKAGTSTIHDWISQLEEVSLPSNKETHYFSNDYKYQKGKTWYLNQFNIYKKTILLGEIDPSYILKNTFLKRIKETYIENPKFIFIFRKPLERSFSHYLMSVQRGYESKEFNDALNEEGNRMLQNNNDFSLINYSYLSRSSYSSHLHMFKQIFPDAECLFLNFDSLLNVESQIVMFKNIIEFLEIKNYNENINLNVIKNSASTYRSKLLQKILYKDYVLKHIINKALPEILISKCKFQLDKLNKKPINQSDKKILENIVDKKYLIWNNNEIEKLQNITKMKFENWYYNV